MPTSVFFAPDLHKRDVDFSSIKGYRTAVEQVQQDILEYLWSLEGDRKFVSLGDWYDKGYRSTGRVYVDSYYDSMIAQAVNSEAYLCLGNHFFLERDSNPEMYLIQPSYLYQPKERVPMHAPVFKTVPYLVIGPVQISFFHFNKLDKNYVQPRQPGVQFHIGVYHDDCCLPSDIRTTAGYFGKTNNDYLNNIFSNIDMAVFGHIHVAVGIRVFTLNSGKQIPLIVPGALCITENKDAVKHKTVSCPVLTVQDDGTYDVNFKEMSTHMEVLQFYKIAEQRIANDTLEIMGTGGSEFVVPKAVSLLDYLRGKGYTEKQMEIIMSVQPGQTDLYTLLVQIKEAMENGAIA